MNQKTLVDLDRDMVDETAKVLGTKTIEDTLHEAMRRVLADEAHLQAIEMFANMDPEQLDLITRARKDAW